ncbi:MAG: ADP-ribosylglycohydrolase family protein, partial [Bacteroidetes bacterium]
GKGLECIPEESGYAACIKDVLAWHGEFPGQWEKCWERIMEKYFRTLEHQPFHRRNPGAWVGIDAKINGAFIVLGLLYGRGDMDSTIIYSMRCGLDSDCNPSNAAGILATTIGYRDLPGKFRSGLDRARKFSYTDYSFDDLVRVSEKLARQLVIREGGRIREKEQGGPCFIIRQNPVTVPRYEPASDPGPFDPDNRYTEAEREMIKAYSCKSFAPEVGETYPGWEIYHAGRNSELTLLEYDGMDRVLAISPMSPERSALLEFTLENLDVSDEGVGPGAAGRDSARLTFSVMAEPGYPWRLNVRIPVRGYQAGREQFIDGALTGGWQNMEFTFPVYAGKIPRIQLEVIADDHGNAGRAYIANLAVKTVRQGSAAISGARLRDRITGGILGQFFGNLNGLEHENRYTVEPGNVAEYIPDLSGGAYTDDDTDIEFVYLYHMRETGRYLLPYEEVCQLWKNHINDKIWCSNRYARNMMDLGIPPPFTGRIALNPWAGFNISGQFLCEQFALVAPGMPQTAARMGIHYTHVAIDGEPAQATQLFTAMISTAFFEESIPGLVAAGLKAVDPASEIHGIVSKVLGWYNAHPDDWKDTRESISDTFWNGEFGGPGGTNGYRVTTAATIAALLHGKGDFVEALRMAFNFGWDADNVAATVGTIMGVLRGEEWIRAQGWKIRDRYVNDRRPGLPDEMTIMAFADMHCELAVRVILQNGGRKAGTPEGPGFLIRVQEPVNIERLPLQLDRTEELRDQLMPVIREGLEGDSLHMAKSVYYAVCLGLADVFATESPQRWQPALEAFKPYYLILCGEEQWSPAARAGFRDAVYGKKSPD